MNPFFPVVDGEMHAEGVALSSIAARFGTPCYVYSKAALVAAYRDFERAFEGRDHLICYAMKANSSLAILNLFARLGAGFDIVSGGELARVQAAGGDTSKVVFSGVGKTEAEIRTALAAGIKCFNVESASELERLNHVAGEMGKVAPISFRVNPNVDAKTHPYISTGLRDNKFGVAYEDALALYRKARAMQNIAIKGIDYHIGSTVTDIAPFAEAFEKVLSLVDRLEADGIAVSHIDIGGGVGIRYKDETPPTIAEYAAHLLKRMGTRKQTILMEPGRALVGSAGILLTRVEYLKHQESRNFAIVDAAMNDLIRPALYEAYHEIVAVKPGGNEVKTYDVVGPVCETADFLGHGRRLALAENDLLAVMATGAYGSAMSSNYNSRPRAAAVMVDGNKTYLITERESVMQLFARERLLPDA
ncbi:MAG: diaminopimelate decarboxylase [Burkholderiales bacterium]